MSEDRPTISSSRLTATEVARHSFGNVRRGFDPHEVRSFLDSVARELQLAEQREQDLRGQVAAAEERALHPVLDESTLSAALGQQSANVLRAAHEEAARILAAAEESAAAISHQAQRQATEAQLAAEATAARRIADAELAASGIRQQIERESAELLEAARIDGDELLARAREQGRALVERAQLARREVLADLAQRRRDLHLQIEQLRAARDELTAIVRGVRGSVDGIVADLVRADDEARAAAAEVARRPPSEIEGHDEVEAIEEQIETGLVDGVRIDRLADLGPEPDVEAARTAAEPAEPSEHLEARPAEAAPAAQAAAPAGAARVGPADEHDGVAPADEHDGV
ncbi:MAG TPA: DivIVA domain-containing protein, partial [Acidimicrobiales bacterium]